MATATGDSVYQGGVAQRITDQLWTGRVAAQPAYAHLTPREHDILDLMARGHNNATIADRLVLSLKPYGTTSPQSSPNSGWRRGPRRSREHVTPGLVPHPGTLIPDSRDRDLYIRDIRAR